VRRSPRLSTRVVPRYAPTVSCRKGSPEMCAAVRTLLATTALLTLFLSGFSTLAEALCAADAPVCCNTSYCPLHHPQSRKSGKAQGNCDAMRVPGQTDCSMRACDSALNVAVRSTHFVPVATMGIRGPAIAEANPVSLTQFFPYAATMPAIPPPRA
jgi:hypothetical protein